MAHGSGGAGLPAHGRSARLDRRTFLSGSGAGVLAAVLAGCTGGGQSAQESDAGGDGTLQWWDQFRPLTTLFEDDLFAPYMAANAGVTIERRQLEAPDLGQALQVARRSNQLPDVHSIAGLETAAAALVQDEWFQPVGGLADFEGSGIGDQILEGVHRFDGEIFSFPMFSGRQHDAVPWHNTALLAEAGVDPEEHPQTWDELRAVARRVSDGTEAHGVVVPSQDPAYLSALVHRLAMSAGAPGAIDWTTGDYVQGSDEFVAAVEFLLALQADGVVHPSSASMGPRDARARWAAGEAAVYLWGSWFIGGLLVDEPDAVDRGLSCWRLPSPTATRHVNYSGPAGGAFWVSVDSGRPEVAADLLLQMTTREFQSSLASAMDQPPALLEVVEEADVHPAYAQSVAYFQEDVRVAPSPEVAHPGVWRVLAQMRDVRPHVGDIMQSALTGDAADVGGALRRYQDEISAERDRAVEAVRAEGDDVTLDAWVFPNWERGADYQQQDYQAR